MTPKQRNHRELLREAAALLQSAIDLPFSNDQAAWDKWCDHWRPRAEAVIKAVRHA